MEKITLGGWGWRSQPDSRDQARQIHSQLQEILVQIQVALDGDFWRKAQYAEYCQAMDRCMEIYGAYLAAGERYQRTRVIQEAYCQPGKIEYRIQRLAEYVEEELEEEEAVRGVMARGYYECIQPILTGVEEMESRLKQLEEGQPAPPAPDRKTLLSRYFRGKRLYRFVELREEVIRCQKALAGAGGDREALRELGRRTEQLHTRCRQLREQCRNGRSGAVVAEIGAIAAELEAQGGRMAAESDHYERLRRRLVACAGALPRERLAVSRDETGAYPGDARCLADLKEAYRGAAKALEEVSGFGRYRAAE